MFSGNFCTDFPLKVKYSNFHKIYITIPNQSLDIYIYFNRPLLVLMCHRFSSVLGIYIYLWDQFSKFVLDVFRFPRYVIRVINNP